MSIIEIIHVLSDGIQYLKKLFWSVKSGASRTFRKYVKSFIVICVPAHRSPHKTSVKFCFTSNALSLSKQAKKTNFDRDNGKT